MKNLCYIFVLISCNVFGQTELSTRFEELASDTISKRTVLTHSSLKPQIRQQNTLPSGEWKLSAISDLNFILTEKANFKTGIGGSVRSNLSDKFYIDLNAIGGYYSTDSIYNPNVFVRNLDTTSGIYSDIRSRISYTPNKFFNFQVGLDNNFIGEGNRSLLLGDYGVSNPFGLIRMNFWQFEYSVLYQFSRERDNNRWESKFNAAHHISLNITKWLNIGIFESVIFQPKDTLLNRGFDVEYLNPMIFYRPQEYSLGSSDNVIMGAELSLFYRSHCFYSQFVLDEFSLVELRAKSGWWANKFGAQFGFKGRFAADKNKFFYRLEYNFVKPYTYAHISEELNFGNQQESMAHPYHSNFMEILGEFKWAMDKWGAKLFANYYLRGDDKDGFSYGGNMYQSYTIRPYEYDHRIGQGIQKNGVLTSLTVYYKLLNHGSLHVFLDNQWRYDTRTNKNSFTGILGIRSFLWNDYRNY